MSGLWCCSLQSAAAPLLPLLVGPSNASHLMWQATSATQHAAQAMPPRLLAHHPSPARLLGVGPAHQQAAASGVSRCTDLRDQAQLQRRIDLEARELCTCALLDMYIPCGTVSCMMKSILQMPTIVSKVPTHEHSCMRVP
jgi:hypothetical protein